MYDITPAMKNGVRIVETNVSVKQKIPVMIVQNMALCKIAPDLDII